MRAALYEAILALPREVLVYGTLKRGKGNHPMIEGAEFLGTQAVRGEMYEAGGIPFLVQEEEAENPREYEVERYRLSDEQMVRVTLMELQAGYTVGKSDGAVVFYYPAEKIDTRYHKRINEF